MSDHVDGPRSMGEPAADLTDLFAFTSPENSAQTVLAACVFPSAGEDAIFSNVIDYSIVVRRVGVAEYGERSITGFFAWLMWGLLHLRTLSDGHSKLSIVANWLRLLVTYRRSARLIVEPAPTACRTAPEPEPANAQRIGAI